MSISDPKACVVLVPCSEAIAAPCEDSLRVLESRGYEVRRMRGFSQIDVARNTIASNAANIHTAKQHGPDRVIGFSPIPAMSMVSYAAGSRYLSLLAGRPEAAPVANLVGEAMDGARWHAAGDGSVGDRRSTGADTQQQVLARGRDLVAEGAVQHLAVRTELAHLAEHAGFLREHPP